MATHQQCGSGLPPGHLGCGWTTLWSSMHGSFPSCTHKVGSARLTSKVGIFVQQRLYCMQCEVAESGYVCTYTGPLAALHASSATHARQQHQQGAQRSLVAARTQRWWASAAPACWTPAACMYAFRLRLAACATVPSTERAQLSNGRAAPDNVDWFNSAAVLPNNAPILRHKLHP